MKKFNVGLFVQETRSIDVEAESQEDAEEKVRDMLVELGTEEEDMIQLYNESDTKLEIREIEVFADKRLIFFDTPEDLYAPPEDIKVLMEAGDVPQLESKDMDVE
jgi:hypothetical protein